MQSEYEPVNIEDNIQKQNINWSEENKFRNVLAKDIARKIKSLDHFVYLWGHKHNYYLPPKHSLT